MVAQRPKQFMTQGKNVGLLKEGRTGKKAAVFSRDPFPQKPGSNPLLASEDMGATELIYKLID